MTGTGVGRGPEAQAAGREHGHERPVPAPQHDGDLIARSVARPDAFGPVFDRHFVAIHRYLARRVGTQLADDLAASVFAEAFAGRGRFDRAQPNAAPWLFGIATNLLRRHHRTEATRWRAFARHGLDPVAVDDGTAQRAERDATSAAIARVLHRLPHRDRDTLLLATWAGLTYDEIAAVLEVPVGTVRSRINRAKARLRASLGTEVPVDDRHHREEIT